MKSSLIVAAIVSILLPLSAFSSDKVNIYTQRQPFLIEPILDEFTKDTGIETSVLFAKKGLAQRVKAEGKGSPADIIITVDIASIALFQDEGLLSSINTPTLIHNVPNNLRASDDTWYALTKRSRVIAVNKNDPELQTITSYEDLADPKWQGKICTRKGSHVYNRALLASIIAEHGYDEAKKWAQALVNNLARKPQGNDRAQAKAIYQGECSIAVMNHYYYNKMVHSKEKQQQDWANAIALIYPNQDDRGAHMNISAAAIAKYSPNKDNAVALLEYLTSPKAQNLYASLNFEFPVNANVSIVHSQYDQALNENEQGLKEDDVALQKIYTLSTQAQKIINEVGW